MTELLEGWGKGTLRVLGMRVGRPDDYGPGRDGVIAGTSACQATVEFWVILFPLPHARRRDHLRRHRAQLLGPRQRIANQGARWAAVNNWPPDCPVNASTCPSPNTLQESLERMALSRGLEGTVNAEVCFPTGNKNVGDSVRVRLTAHELAKSSRGRQTVGHPRRNGRNCVPRLGWEPRRGRRTRSR